MYSFFLSPKSTLLRLPVTCIAPVETQFQPDIWIFYLESYTLVDALGTILTANIQHHAVFAAFEQPTTGRNFSVGRSGVPIGTYLRVTSFTNSCAKPFRLAFAVVKT
jgi:hypothetical protein